MHCYEHLEATWNISCSDTLDKIGKILLETQVKFLLPNDVNSKKKDAKDSDKLFFINTFHRKVTHCIS